MPPSRRSSALPLSSARAITLDLPVRETDATVGRTLAELRLPRDAVITSVLRDGTVLIPRGHLTLEPGDRLQLLTLASMRDQIVQHIHTGLVEEDDADASS
ncbi:MAG: hypothetical protein IH957_11705 [Chloroflexi bacterium]|nr:hypothetical protein [Chloroflexota bacterium]